MVEYAYWEPLYYHLVGYEGFECHGHVRKGVFSLSRRVVSMASNMLKGREGKEREQLVSRYSQSPSSKLVEVFNSAGLLIEVLSHRSGNDALGCLNHYLDAVVCVA